MLVDITTPRTKLGLARLPDLRLRSALAEDRVDAETHRSTVSLRRHAYPPALRFSSTRIDIEQHACTCKSQPTNHELEGMERGWVLQARSSSAIMFGLRSRRHEGFSLETDLHPPLTKPSVPDFMTSGRFFFHPHQLSLSSLFLCCPSQRQALTLFLPRLPLI